MQGELCALFNRAVHLAGHDVRVLSVSGYTSAQLLHLITTPRTLRVAVLEKRKAHIALELNA